MTHRRRSPWGPLIQLLLVLNAVSVLGPLVIAVFSAFKSTREIFAAPFWPPT